MYREIAGTDERDRVIPGVRDRRVRATKDQLYVEIIPNLGDKTVLYLIFNHINCFL